MISAKFFLLLSIGVIAGVLFCYGVDRARAMSAEFEKKYNEYLRNHGEKYLLDYKDISLRLHLLMGALFILLVCLLVDAFHIYRIIKGLYNYSEF